MVTPPSSTYRLQIRESFTMDDAASLVGYLREQARAYWRTTDTGHAPQQELRRAWRIYQGQDTQRVDAHTRKPAQADAWYAEPADYESLVLYSEPFVTREEAEAWAKAHY